MFPQFQIRKGATVPYLRMQLFQEGVITLGAAQSSSACGATKAGTPIPLPAGTQIRARMFKCGRIPAEKILFGQSVIVDADNGEVEFRWHPTDTDTVGHFYFQWDITFPAGQVLIFPYQREAFSIEVTP